MRSVFGPGFSAALAGDAPGAEHIVRVENGLIIEIDVRKCIQPGENQVEMIMRERGGIHLKRGLIFPVGQPDPLQMKFIVAIEWVGNQLVVQ